MYFSDSPLVSVLTTAFNREKYIAEAIESVLNSTYKNLELIVVDDCSKDNTVTIIKSYEEKDKRLRLYINERNLGDYPNRNKAASYATGEFLMFVDSDDMILKDGIENCVSTMLKFKEANFGMYKYKAKETPYKLESSVAIRKHFFEKNFLMIGPSGTIIRRSFFESIKGYPEKYGPSNDNYFNLKACSYSDLVMLPFDFFFYRYHEEQEQKNQYSYLYNNYLYEKDALKELSLPLTKTELIWLNKKINRRFLVNIFKYFIRTFEIRKTVSAIKRSGFTFKDAITGTFH